MFRVFRNRDFALLWVGGLVSVAGDWVLYAALPFFVYEQTGSTVATAGMIVASLAPSVLFGSVAGVFVDRWDRKRVLVVANLVQALVVALLLLVPNGGWLWVVYAVAVVQSIVASFSMPAESALLPTLVGADDLVAANALNVLNNRIGRLAGLPLGAALLGVVGLEGVVVFDSISFVLAALLIAPIHALRPQRETTADEAGSSLAAFWREWLDGMRIVFREPTIVLLFFVFGLMTFGGTMLDPLTVAWVRDVLSGGPEIFAGLLTAHAASGILGSLLLARFGTRLTARDLIGWASLIAGAALVLKYNIPSIGLALALSVVGGITSVASNVGVETLAQQAVRDEFRGRVFGALGASGGLLSLLGAVTGGALAQVVGTVTMLNVASALIVIGGLVVLLAYNRDGSVAPSTPC